MTSSDDPVKVHRQAARLRAQLKESQTRVQELERRLEALENSTTVQVGRLVAGAARNPKRRAPRLPRELYRVWKQRHAPRPAKGGRDGEHPVEPDRVDRPENRLLVAGPHEGPIVAGVLAPGTADALRRRIPALKVVELYPHDAATVLPGADVDALVVDARAGDPGGPWAYLGVPGVFDRERALHHLRDLARRRDLPRVLVGDPVPPVLASLDWDATDLAAALSHRKDLLCDLAPSSTATSIST
ncbi:hypothetical protein ACSNOI_00140 [Actinomadura kijaniata]|uniref:hypothetical protein n=1 Tax=Actinomadura kijaniata TaxID=46161 RepID=UPI003F1C131A